MPISCLHHLGRGGDLQARHGPEPRLPQLAQRLLRGIGLGHRLRRDCIGQVLVARPGAVGLVEIAGGIGGWEHDHSSRAWRDAAHGFHAGRLLRYMIDA